MTENGSHLVQIGDRLITYDAPVGTTSDSGKTVLFVHGTSFNRGIWSAVVHHLAQSHHPIAIDNPGHGGSSLPAIGTIDEGVALLKQFHDTLGLTEIVLIGHSMGGALAQSYYNHYPADVAALGLVSTAPRFHLDPEMVQRWLADPAAYRMEEMVRIVAPTAPESVKGALFHMRDTTTPGGQRNDLLACTTWNNEDKSLDIHVPTLAVTAEYDREYFQQSAAMWAEKLPNAELVSIQDAGHMMMLEKPAEFIEALCSWLSRLSTGPIPTTTRCSPAPDKGVRHGAAVSESPW